MHYTVLATDGKTYGPATIEMLKMWAQQGRLTVETVLREEETGRHLPAGQLEELRAFLPQGYGASAAPPPPNSSPPAHSSYSAAVCPNCGQAVHPRAAFCQNCGYGMQTGYKGRLLTGNASFDSVLGFIACLLLPGIVGAVLSRTVFYPFGILPLLACFGLYFVIRQPVPAFARGWKYGLLLMLGGIVLIILLFLGLLVVCMGSMR